MHYSSGNNNGRQHLFQIQQAFPICLAQHQHTVILLLDFMFKLTHPGFHAHSQLDLEYWHGISRHEQYEILLNSIPLFESTRGVELHHQTVSLDTPQPIEDDPLHNPSLIFSSIHHRTPKGYYYHNDHQPLWIHHEVELHQTVRLFIIDLSPILVGGKVWRPFFFSRVQALKYRR